MEILAAVVFIAQLICCKAVKHKIWRFAPTLLVAAMMCITVLNASLGRLEPQTLVTETVLIIAGGFAAALYYAVGIIWKRMKDRK